LIFRLSALLHDIGHPPLSHSTKDSLKEAAPNWSSKGILSLISAGKVYDSFTIKDRSLNHEIIGLSLIGKVIVDPSKARAIRAILQREITVNDTTYQKLFTDLDRKLGCSPGGLKTLLNYFIDGDFSVDRLDYLMRDAHFTGVKIGVDLDHLLSSMNLDVKDENLIINIKSNCIPTLNLLHDTAHLMYQNVYYHPKSILLDHDIKSFATTYFAKFLNNAKSLDDFKNFTDLEFLVELLKSNPEIFNKHQNYRVDDTTRLDGNAKANRELRVKETRNANDIKVFHNGSPWTLTMLQNNTIRNVFVHDERDKKAS
jgi:HD superfamily phosphohydrolase